MVESALPLFPLPNVVLFPGMPLTLHVFEPRYRRMVEDAVVGVANIGMVLLKPGWQENYEGSPAVYDLGCAGVLEFVEPLDDGRYNILLRGRRRVRIRAERAPDPYRVAEVDGLDDPEGEPEPLFSLRGQLLERLAKGMKTPPALADHDLSDELFVNALCQTLELDVLERQSLLSCDTICARARRLLEILDFLSLERALGRRDRALH